MINMYSMGSSMMGGMNNMYGVSGNNMHKYYKERYGVGYPDFGTRPYAQPYPMAIIPRNPSVAANNSWWSRFVRKYFS